MPFSFVLLLAFTSLQVPNAPAQNASPKDALALLTEVSQRYADAKSYHIEAFQESTSSNELQHSWQKTLFTAIVMPGGRYRYEGRSGYAGAVVVSDGTTQWIYHVNERRYTQSPASPTYPQKGSVIPHEENPTMEAADLAHEMAHLAHRLKSAVFLPDETLSVNGREVECYAIHYSDKDFKTLRGDDLKQEETVWIDKSRRVVIKTLNKMESYMFMEPHVHIPIHTETTVTYPVVELDGQEPASAFSFVAPADATLIAEFPDPFAKDSQFGGEDLTGKPAPELSLKPSEGKTIMLSGFRGHPVFIEFWATWCGPCVELMPELSKLYAELKGKDLAWISIDDDEDSSDAAKFISRERIPWPNYHDEDGSLGKAFHRVGIPLGVLIDGDGKIVFYQSGYEISQLRAAIAKLGPQFSSVASRAAKVQ
jgi:thiol-disulfide isomerase/thioredoxin